MRLFHRCCIALNLRDAWLPLHCWLRSYHRLHGCGYSSSWNEGKTVHEGYRAYSGVGFRQAKVGGEFIPERGALTRQ